MNQNQDQGKTANGPESNEDLYQLTLQTLLNAEPSLQELRRRFDACSDAFDTGNDDTALEIIRNCTSDLHGFALFLAAVANHMHNSLRKRTLDSLVAKQKALTDAIGNVNTGLVNTSYSEVSDTFRYDLIPLMTDFSKLLPQILEEVKTPPTE